MKISFGIEDDGVLKYPDWQKSLQEALVEFDKVKLKSRVSAAETAVVARLQAISRSSDHSSDHRDERQAIEYALALIRILKQDALEFSDREKK